MNLKINKIKKIDKNINGFSLLEVLVALAIIAIAFTSVVKLQGQSILMGRGVQFYNVVPLLAQQKLADIELEESFFMEGEGGFGDEFPNYRWKITTDDSFSCNVNESDLSLKKITILISDNTYKYQIVKYKFVPKN